MAQTLIVIVSRDRAVLEGLGRSLLRKGLAWRGAEDLDEAWRLLSSASVLAVVGDVDCDGLSLCKELPRRFGADAPPCLLLDTMSKESRIEAAYAAGALDVLCKPLSAAEFHAKLSRALGGKLGDLKLPATIDGLEVLALLDCQADSKVYKVRDPDSGALLELKLVDSRHADMDRVLRFRREVNLLTGLRHPNLVDFERAGNSHGRFYYTVQHVPGKHLSDRLKQSGPCDEETAREVGLAAACALEHLHGIGVLHRNLTTRAIHLGTDGVVRLGGLDWAKRSQDHQLTGSGGWLDRSSPTAPEVLTGDPWTTSTDLYTLGLMLLSALLGRSPLAGLEGYERARAVAEGEVIARVDEAGAKNGGISDELARLIRELLAVRPEERPLTAREVRSRLELDETGDRLRAG